MEIRPNSEGQTLENKIEVEVGEAKQAIAQLETGIKSLKSTINSISKSSGISNLTNQVNNANKSAITLSKTWSAVKKAINFSAIYLGARQALSAFNEMTDASVNYTETVNLFNVSFGKEVKGLNKYYEQAIKFQEELEEKFGINIEESMRYQAIFNSMSKSMGINAQKAEILSENMTKLGYDLASLYNIDPEDAMTKLRAGLAGQTEPLRELGLDITEQSLKPVAQSLGINESIRNMSQAEKTILRYIAVLRQAQIAQGDFARTMDSPANQLRIFNAQVTAFKRNMGNLWQGLLGNILPYINAIMMVINELLKMVAKLFGFEVSSQPINISTSVGADDLADDLGTAGKKAKELKAQLMGFDEINNINLDNDTSSSGGGSSGATGTGIDKRLLDALKGYENGMDNITNKATELRDKMLAWLGFERDDDRTWKLKEGLTNFEKILDVVKLIGIALGTWKISSTITNILKNLGILKGKQNFQIAFGLTLSLTGLFAQYKGTKHLLNGDMDLFTLLETFLGTTSGAFGIASILKTTKKGKALSLGNKLKVGFGIMLGIQGVQVFLDGINNGDIKKIILGAFEGITSLNVAFKNLFGNSIISSIKKTSGNISTFGSLVIESFQKSRASGLSLGKSFVKAGEDAMKLVPTSVKVVGGLTGLVTSSTLAYSAMQDLSNGTIDSGEAFGKLTASIGGAAASGALIGNSILPGVGTAIGAVTGALIAGSSALLGYSDNTKELKENISKMTDEINSSREAYESQLESIEDTKTSQLVEMDYITKLKDELSTLVDENGKVKKGYKERVDYILNEVNEALGTEYKLNGDVIDSYKEMIDNIEDLIDEKKKKVQMEAYEEKYKESLKEQIEIQDKLKEAQQQYNDIYAEWQEANEKAAKSGSIIDMIKADSLYEEVKKARGNVETLQDDLTNATKNVGDAEFEMLELTVANMDEITDETLQNNQELFGTLANVARDYTDDFIAKIQTLEPATRGALLGQLDSVTAVKPEIIEEWKKLANESINDFNAGLSTMPEDVQATILSSVTTIDNLSPEMIETWADLAFTSKTDFNNALSSLPEDIQGTILQGVAKVEGFTENSKEAWANLANKSETAYNNALKGLPSDTKEKIQSAVNEVNGKQKTMEKAGGNLADAGLDGASEKVNDKENGASSIGKWFVEGFLKKLTSKDALSGAFNAGWKLISSALSGGNEAQETGSPAKKTIEMGNFYTEGYIIGIKKKMSEVKKVASNLVGIALEELEQINENGFNINTEDFKINSNQFIDYGAISGNIDTQIKVDSLPDKVKQAVIEGMSSVSIPVEIEARTDDGIVFTKVQTKAREYEMQTGRPAFEF